MTTVLQLIADAKILIGAPAKPLPPQVLDDLGRLVATFPSVMEGHLPYGMLSGVMTKPSDILVLGLAASSNAEIVARAISLKLPEVLPTNESFFILPTVGETPLLKKVRAVGCRIFPPLKRQKIRE